MFTGFLQSKESCVLGLTTDMRMKRRFKHPSANLPLESSALMQRSGPTLKQRSHQLAPLHSLLFLIEHIFPHLFESSSQRAESFVQAADLWDFLLNSGPHLSKWSI